jgi:hypothetical protein
LLMLIASSEFLCDTNVMCAPMCCADVTALGETASAFGRR